MSSGDFPSGPWTGFYTYNVSPGKYPTDLILAFESGRMTGEGRDEVGPFVISGRYDPQAKECWWTKSYVGAHDVAYTGFREGKGIWGTWEIGGWHRGGFHIWPLGADGETEAAQISAERELAGVAEVTASAGAARCSPSRHDTSGSHEPRG